MRCAVSVIYLMVIGMLTGCGVAYHSPVVRENFTADTKVRVLPVTPSSVVVANRTTYIPKELPSVFFTSAGTGSVRGIDQTAPRAVTDLQDKPPTLTRHLPGPVTAGPYQIGIGDVLVLATPQANSTVEQLSGLLAAQNRRQGYTVQDDGAIAIPDIGRVQVNSLTIEQAEDALFQALVSRQIVPSFSLEVAEFNSKRVSIGGSVGTPSVVPITLKPLYLQEALAKAGGLQSGDLDFASVRIYRDGTLYQVPVRDLYEGRADRIQLLDGDTIFVDTEFELTRAQAYFEEQIRLAEFRQRNRAEALRALEVEVSLRRATLNEARGNFRAQVEFDAVARDYVYLVGELNTQGRMALPFGRQASLADILFGQGSFDNETGNPRQIYVLRGAQNPREFGAFDAWQLDARIATNFIVATRFNMRPNDIVFVAQQPVTRWARVVQQITPNLIAAGTNVATN